MFDRNRGWGDDRQRGCRWGRTPSRERSHGWNPGRPWLTSWSLSDWLLAATVLVAPLVMGGRQPTGRLVLIALIGTLAVGWCWRQGRAGARWRLTGLEAMWLAAVLLLLLQLTPLPPEMWRRLTPEAARSLPLWRSSLGASLGLAPWSTISLTPVATLRGLALLAAYGMLLVVVVQRLETWDDIRRLMWLLAVAGLVMAGVGLLQRAAGNGKFLWVYSHPYRLADDVVKGPFTNQNHFAHFLSLSLGPWLALAALPAVKRANSVRPIHRDARHWLPAAGAAIVLFAAALTFSRGGAIAIAAAAAVTGGLLVRAKLIGRRSGPLLACALLAVAALTAYGMKPLGERLSTLASGDMQQISSARVALWRAAGRSAPKYLLAGGGVGSHREIYPQYMPEQFGVELTHAENGYLQVLLETGVVGVLLLACGIWKIAGSAWYVFRLGASAEQRAFGAAALGGLAASLAHSLGDFVWYIPACMTMTLLLSATALRGRQLLEQQQVQPSPHDRSQRRPMGGKPMQERPTPWALGALAAAAVTLWMISVALPPALAGRHWDQYLRLSLEAQKFAQQRSMTAPALRQMAEHLERAVAADPHRPRPRLRLASVRLKLFEQLQTESENPMPLAQLREAAELSRDAFGSIAEQQQWLKRAVGENLVNAREALRHAKLALQACPLQGDAYVLLSELAFLDSLESRRAPLLQQALRLRPYSGLVLFACGSHWAMQGEPERATSFWRAAFHRHAEVRQLLIRMLTPQVRAAELIAAMRPDREAMVRIRMSYVQLGRRDEARVVAVQLARRSQRQAQEGEDTTAWRQAQHWWREAGEPGRSIECGIRAMRLAPHDFEVRSDLARSYIGLGRVDQARPHLEYCRRRRPDDESVRTLWQELSRLSRRDDLQGRF